MAKLRGATGNYRCPVRWSTGHGITKKKDHFTALPKSASLIKKLVDKSLYPLLYNKTMAKLWTICKNLFYHISPMSISRIFIDTYNIKLLECKDVIDYMSRYQIAFNKLISFINKDSWMSKKSIKMTS